MILPVDSIAVEVSAENLPKKNFVCECVCV